MVGYRVWAVLRRGALRAGFALLFACAWGAGCAGQSTGDGDGADQCPSVCEKSRHCPGMIQSSQSCDDDCLGQDALALESGCHDQYLKSVACLAKLPDVCTGLKDCPDVLGAAACEQKYCSSHQSASVCVNLKQ